MNNPEENGADDDGIDGDGDGPDRPRYGTYDYLRQFQHAPANAPPNSEMIRDLDLPGTAEENRRRDRPLAGADARARARRSRGPKGYVRADRRILEDVCERLTDDEDLDPSGFAVTVDSGRVTLTGTVDSEWARRYAEHLVYTVPGVESCRNRLQVVPPAGQHRS